MKKQLLKSKNGVVERTTIEIDNALSSKELFSQVKDLRNSILEIEKRASELEALAIEVEKLENTK